MSEGPNSDFLSPGWIGQRTPRACIIGLGLIGGSWAGALHRLGWQVWAVEREKDSLAVAKQKGWIQEGWTEIPPVLDVDLVVLALPLQALLAEMDLSGRLYRGTIVTDVGSIKSDICQKNTGRLGQGWFFIGGHPMAGSEKSGFNAAQPDLFQGYPYVLTPGEACPREAVLCLDNLLQQMGARVAYRDPAQHDKQVAMVSHIPHLLAVSLMLAANDLAGKAGLDLAGRSFRDITRIVESSPEMWQEIIVGNADAILEGLASWQQQLDKLSEYVRVLDGQGIAEAFRDANRVRETLL